MDSIKVKNMQIQIGSRVQSLYNDRIGIVLKIGTHGCDNVRLHIQWLKESDGKPVLSAGKNTGNGIKTWVSQTKVKLL